MSERIIVTLHLPLNMAAVSRILKAAARDYPDASLEVVGGAWRLIADPDVPLSERRRIAAARRADRG